MELYYLLFLFLFNCFDVEALLRVEREATCPQITNFSGRVKYRRRGTRAVFRCPKKFDRYGPKFATCQDDGTWSNEPPLCTKTGCLPLDQNLESNLITDVVNQAVVKFSCDQNYHLLGETLAYCDGKDWSAPLPRCAAPHELTECDFEEDLCGWAQDDSDEQDWIRTLGPTPTGNTGPKYDHTYGDTGNGHYLFFETSNPTLTGHQAILYSPIYNEHLSPMCFDFWYHILGPYEAGHVGSLEVFVLDQSQFIDDDNIQPLFVKEGNQGDKWQRGDIFIDSQVESYQITIVATRALSYISDIAIDDVRLYNCSRKNGIGRATTMEQTSNTPTHPIKKSTTTMKQTGRGIKSTKAISTTNVAETGTPLPTTVTTKKINPSFKPTTTIKKAAQSMSDLTRALSSIATTAMTQTTIIPRPSKTESTNTTTQSSSTPKLPTTETTIISTQTTATPRFSTARSITTASQTSATPNRSETESTTQRTQTSTTPTPVTTESTTFTKQTPATPRFSTAKSITTISQTSTTPNRSETESATETTQTSTTPKPFTTESTTITTQTSATPRFSTGKSITTASQTFTTPNRSETEYATETTQTSTTPRPFTTESTTFTKQTSATPRFSTGKSITTASQTSTTQNRSETESTTETTQISTRPKPFTTESTTITTQTSATPRFSTAKSITIASQTSTTPNRFRTGPTTSTTTTQASTPLKCFTTMFTTTTTQTSSTPRPSSTTSVKTSSKDKILSKMRTSTSKIDLPTKTTSTSSTMFTSVCCISSTTSPSSTLITKKDISTTHQTSTDHMNDITGKEKVISDSQKTNTEKTQTSTSGTTHVSKPTKRTDALSTKQSVISKTTRGNSISVSNKRSQNIENEILISLVIGLCVGMVAGSIIICMIACVCVRRRKFYTSSYEGELKPMKKSDSVQSLDNGHCEENENRTSANLENQYPMPKDAGSSLTALT